MFLRLLKSYIQTKYFRRFRSREQLKTWQNAQVKNHLDKILPLSPFYSSYFQHMPVEDWKSLPCIDKNIMMENFNFLNTQGINKEEAFEIAYTAEKSRSFSPTLGNTTIGLSSGTSGNRGLFLVSPEERDRWTGTILAKVLPGSLFEKQTIALFLRANSNLYQTIKNKHLQFHFYDLFVPLLENIEKLRANPPTILVAPPSVLRMIVEAKLKIMPRKVISIAEVLDPIDEAYLSAAFNQKIHQIYQCTEGFLGVTCSHGTLHLNEDVAVFQKEYIGPHKFVPIITDFHRTTQPIIRYRLNDILTERTTPCPCGSIFTALEKIEGRCDDIFHLSKIDNPKELVPIFPDYLRGAIVDASSRIQEFMVTQKSPDLIEIALKCDRILKESLENKVTHSLETLWERMNCIPPKMTFVDYHYSFDDKKMRRVRSEYVPHSIISDPEAIT